MNIESVSIEDTPVYKYCKLLVESLQAQDQHEYSDELKALHSSVRGALALKFKEQNGTATVSFRFITPKETER